MSPADAARATRRRIANVQAVRDPHAKATAHAAWMLEEIADEQVVGDKAHRWLGYAQALLVVRSIITLEEAKAINDDA